ncbi:MAG: hypothetical protein LBQ47_04540 [Endomicrobium sp.]|nr:hypothetical protein [Endomicrobium sp.]
MSIKKTLASFTAFCFLWSVTAQSAAAGAAQIAANDVNVLNDQIFSSDLGHIIDAKSYGTKQVIVNIQDLHSHPQVQKNIAQIIEKLDDKYNVKAIYVEGASGKVDLSWLSSISSGGDIKNKIAEQLILDGRLTGVEYYAFEKNKNNVFGLEDANVHKENVERLGKIYSNESQYQVVIAKVKNEIGWLSNKYLGASCKNFLNLAARYNAKKISDHKFYASMFKYVKQINAAPEVYGNILPIDESEYGELKKIIAINEMAEKLKVNKVNAELSQYVSELKNKISYSQFNKMSEGTGNFKDIDALCKYIEYYGIEGNSKPNLRGFVAVKNLSSQINPVALFFQEQKLRETIISALSSSIQENEISFLNNFFYFFQGYLTNSLTAKDERYFMETFQRFRDIYAKYSSSDHLKSLSENFPVLNDYYSVNNQRNEIFLQNINKNTQLVSGDKIENEPPLAVLNNSTEIIIVVTGGYHTHGISELLDAKKISNVVITPRITEGLEAAEANYRQIIAQQSMFFSQTLAPSLDLPALERAFTIFNAAARLYELKALSSEQAKKAVSDLKSIFENVKPQELIGALTQQSVFTAGALDMLTGFLKDVYGENNLVINVSDTYYNIKISGAEITFSKNADGSYTLQNVQKPPESSDMQNLESFTLGFTDIIALAQNVLSNSFDLYSLTDINNAQTYETFKKIFIYAAYSNYDLSKKGVYGVIPEIEQNYKDKSVDEIPYELIGRMPEFFQKAAFQKQREKDETKPSEQPSKSTSALVKMAKFIVGLFFMLMLAHSLAGAPVNPNPLPTPQVTVEIPISNNQIRGVYPVFSKGAALTGSYAGSTDEINNDAQKLIAERGVILYDWSVYVKALLLYPEENKDLVGKMVTALHQAGDVRSNKDFNYNGANIAAGHGYFWKIVDIYGRFLKDQAQPITGENAWIAMTMADIYNAYKGTDIGNKAYEIMNDLGKAMIALQQPSGLIVMAPEDKVGHYAYLGIDYNKVVSVENNISALSALRALAQYANATDRKTYAAAADKLEKALMGMYNKEIGYFVTGIDDKGSKNLKFATDCQTWMILALGVEKLNKNMNDGNFSKDLLKRTLEGAGVKNEKGEYIGVDFINSRQNKIVSFEWTFGFIKAAEEVLAVTPDPLLLAAINSMKQYIESAKSSEGLLPYSDVDYFAQTGHGWIIFPKLKSLASTAWGLFPKDVQPFVIVSELKKTYVATPQEIAKAAPAQKPSQSVDAEKPKAQAAQSAEAAVKFKYGAPNYYGGENWAVAVFDGMAGKNIEKEDVIRIGFDSNSNSPNFLLRMIYEDGSTVYYSNDNLAGTVAGTVKMTKKNGYYEAVVTRSGKLKEVAADFGATTLHYNGKLNPNNNGKPNFNSFTVLSAGSLNAGKAKTSGAFLLPFALFASGRKKEDEEAQQLPVLKRVQRFINNLFGRKTSAPAQTPAQAPAQTAPAQVTPLIAELFFDSVYDAEKFIQAQRNSIQSSDFTQDKNLQDAFNILQISYNWDSKTDFLVPVETDNEFVKQLLKEMPVISDGVNRYLFYNAQAPGVDILAMSDFRRKLRTDISEIGRLNKDNIFSKIVSMRQNALLKLDDLIQSNIFQNAESAGEVFDYLAMVDNAIADNMDAASQEELQQRFDDSDIKYMQIIKNRQNQSFLADIVENKNEDFKEIKYRAFAFLYLKIANPSYKLSEDILAAFKNAQLPTTDSHYDFRASIAAQNADILDEHLARGAAKSYIVFKNKTINLNRDNLIFAWSLNMGSRRYASSQYALLDNNGFTDDISPEIFDMKTPATDLNIIFKLMQDAWKRTSDTNAREFLETEIINASKYSQELADFILSTQEFSTQESSTQEPSAQAPLTQDAAQADAAARLSQRTSEGSRLQSSPIAMIGVLAAAGFFNFVSPALAIAAAALFIYMMTKDGTFADIGRLLKNLYNKLFVKVPLLKQITGKTTQSVAEVNIINVSSDKFEAAKKIFGSQALTLSENRASLPVYMADAALFAENMDSFSNTGIKTGDKSVYSGYIDGTVVIYAENIDAANLAQLLSEGKFKEIISSYLPVSGQISIDPLVVDATVSYAQLRSEFETLTKQPYDPAKTYFYENLSKEAAQVLNKIKNGYEYAENGIPRIYMAVDRMQGDYALTLFDHTRTLKQAEAWTYAKRFIVFLDKINTIEDFNKYFETIFTKATNGNIIITAALAENLSNAGKLNSVIQTARAAGISIMVEDAAEPALQKLFDGTYSVENKTITDALDIAVSPQNVEIIDDKTADFDNALRNSNIVTVIYESAIENHLGADRSGFAKYVLDIWTSSKALANIFDRPLTPETALETARNIDVAKILKEFPDITVHAVISQYSQLPLDLYYNTIFSRYIDKIEAQTSLLLSEEKLTIAKKQEILKEKHKIMTAFYKGALEKLLIAAELKAEGRASGLKNKNIEKLLGQLLAIKYFETKYPADNESVIDGLNNANDKNYIEKITDALMQARPDAETPDKEDALKQAPLGTKTAEKAIELIMVYSKEVEFDKDNFKPDTADTRAIRSILSAA